MEGNDKHGHNKLKICVSGAAETGHCGPGALEKAKALGREVVSQGAILLTGATTGFPLWAAMGAKEAGGISIGFSPAGSEREHLEVYRLPIDYLDLIVYTGFGYSGRDLLLTRSADAVLIGCGRIGTVHEFTIAYEDEKTIGILQGEWDMDEILKNIIDKSNRINKHIIFDESPEKLVKRAIELIKSVKRSDRAVLNGINGMEQEVNRLDQ
ncbi:MAG: hypothetical protein AAB428_01790 [Patescibacteria group bacterium]